MITFTKIRWKNLLSTGNTFTEISLNDTKTCILLGQSGSGKSTLLDAISFSLFNRPFRNINKNQLINSVNEKNCLVEIEFDIGSQKYLIRRGIKPTVFEIYCDNNLINQDSHSKDYQQYLERSILKFNFKAFTQIVVLGASNFTPFMQLKPADRRVIIEGLLDIEIFSVMNSLLKQKVSSLKNSISENEFSFNLIKEKINLQLKYISDLSQNKQDKINENMEIIENNKKHVAALQKEIDSLVEKIEELKPGLSQKSELELQMNKIREIKNKLDSSIKKTNKEIGFYQDNHTCPTCNQDIPDEFKLSEIAKKTDKILDWQNGLTDVESAVSKLLLKLDDIKSIELQIESIQSSILKNRNMMDGAHLFIKKVVKDTLLLKDNTQVFDDGKTKLDQLNEELKLLEEQKKTFSFQKAVQDLAITLLKDNGVKAKIIKQYLPLINKHTNIFLNAMNFFVTFNIDEEFTETIKSRGRDDFCYENFSEGEKQRIDLALLFTWRTIAKLKNSVNTNLLIMDEVLDSYLDTAATENVLQLLTSDMFKDSNIFVISHKETISDKFNKTIRFTKSKNFSTIN
ncbi:endonuclease subunit [uncultured Caudovirales phage]|uniref:Endonuclease subunit n=1 Tax=uncultured Caudovirales phage TaxID=2100421 RepID=A0A6J5M7U3_9CAUD|nr:endonuclease subunit [uncultured Caudovirales phage]